MVPETIVGKIVASVCVLSGLLLIAIPVTIIVTTFIKIYHNGKDEKRKVENVSSIKFHEVTSKKTL
jgi:potassium voltage-gated channel delayed-rectifier subfamily S protein 1